MMQQAGRPWFSESHEAIRTDLVAQKSGATTALAGLAAHAFGGAHFAACAYGWACLAS